MKAYNKNKTDRCCKRDTIKVSKIIPDIDTTSPTNGNIIIQPDRSFLWEYIPPIIEVTWVEMENCLAATSGFALPVKNNGPINETWDNAYVKPNSTSNSGSL